MMLHQCLLKLQSQESQKIPKCIPNVTVVTHFNNGHAHIDYHLIELGRVVTYNFMSLHTGLKY